MAETEQLVVALEARVKDFERNFIRANKTANDNWRNIENRGKRAATGIQRSFSNSSSSVVRSMSNIGGAIPRALGGLSAAISVEAVRRYADAWTNASNKIVAAGVKMNVAGITTEAIADIAQRSRSDFESVADLYARLTRSSQDFNASQKDVAAVTETVAKALKLSGASASETQSTLVQLGQGLSSGKLQGDELRSLLENAPIVAKAIAEEFNVAVGGLKDLGKNGELTAERVFKALKDATPEIEGLFAKTTATTADSFKSLEAAAIKYIGTSGSVKAATGALVSGVNAVARNFDTLASGATALGTVLAVRLIARGLTPTVAGLFATTRAAIAAAPAITTLNATLAASVVSANAGALALRGFSGALALIGGPAGAAILGIGAAAYYFSNRAGEARERSQQYAAALERLRETSEATAKAQRNLGDEIDRTAAKAFEGEKNALRKHLASTQADVAAFTSRLQKLLEQAAGYMRSKPMGKAAGDDVKELARQFKSGEISAEQLKEALYSLANSNPSFQNLADGLSPLLGKLAGAIALSNELQTKLGGVAKAQADSAADKLRRAIPNPTRGTSFDDDANAVNRDPVIRKLIGDGIARRAVIESQTDKTVRKVREKYAELTKTILDAGGTIDPDALRKQAAAIVAAAESTRGGSKSKRSTAKTDDYDRQAKSTQRRIRDLNAEAAAIGKTGFQAAKASEAYRLMEIAKSSGRTITPQLTADIERLASAYALAKTKLDEARKSQQLAKEQAEFFQQSIGDALGDAIIQGQSLDQVFKNLAQSIAKAALQAALFGNGPLAGLTGGSGILSFLVPAKMALGGRVSGPGGPTADRVPAMLSNGEYIVRASATEKHLPLLEAINEGRVSGFSNGGIVNSPRSLGSPDIGKASGSPQIAINAPITVSGSSGSPEQNADLAKRLGRQMEMTMRGTVVSELRKQMRPGNLLG